MSMYLADRDLCPRCGTTVSYSHTVTSFDGATAYFTCDYGNCGYWRGVENPIG